MSKIFSPFPKTIWNVTNVLFVSQS